MTEPVRLSSLSPDDPAGLHMELREIIEAKIAAHPRSQQIEIGASEIGTPCTRKLVWKMGDVPVCNPVDGSWWAALGVAAHDWLADALAMYNDEAGYERFIIEHEVVIGTIAGQQITGHFDAYDTVTCSVIDWKNPAATNVKTMRKTRDVGPTYTVQTHCYGKGCEDSGLEVKRVHIVALPQGGTLRDMYFWSEPYSRSVAVQAIERADTLARASESIGAMTLGALSPTADDYCKHCPWFTPVGADPSKGQCPGGPETRAAWELAAQPREEKVYTGWTTTEGNPQ